MYKTLKTTPKLVPFMPPCDGPTKPTQTFSYRITLAGNQTVSAKIEATDYPAAFSELCERMKAKVNSGQFVRGFDLFQVK